MRCKHESCKNDGKDIERWDLTDSMGYPCGTVCKDCVDAQKSTFNPVIFQDSQDYRQYMAECGENLEDDY